MEKDTPKNKALEGLTVNELFEKLRAGDQDTRAALKEQLRENAGLAETFGQILTALDSLTPEQMGKAIKIFDNWETLEPFLTPILENEGLTDENTASLLEEILNQADAQRANQTRVKAKSTDSLQYPIDKVNNKAWRLLEESDGTGQLTFALEKRGSTKEANAIYSIDFSNLENELQITRKLTAFDKRVYVAIGSLYNAGNEVMTLTQVYSCMGNAGRPCSNDIKNINDSITKLSGARIHLDNIGETNVYKTRRKFEYDGQLLYMERISAYVNGQFVDGAIHPLREPPLIEFARKRGQITTIERKVLESPLRKTEGNLKLDDYLLEAIATMKNKAEKKAPWNNKILYATIYRENGITERKERSRAIDKIRKYLEHYKKTGFIADFKEQFEGVTIVL